MPFAPKRFRANPKGVARLQDKAKRERDAFYSWDAWRTLRAVFLAKNPLCRRCLKEGLATEATIAHHIKERLKFPELSLDESNLEPICNACHTKHHSKARPFSV